MFDKPIFNVSSRQGINLNQKLLGFDRYGFDCSKNLTIAWKDWKLLGNGTVTNCNLNDGNEISGLTLLSLFYRDVGFNGRQWIPKDLLSST